MGSRRNKFQVRALCLFVGIAFAGLVALHCWMGRMLSGDHRVIVNTRNDVIFLNAGRGLDDVARKGSQSDFQILVVNKSEIRSSYFSVNSTDINEADFHAYFRMRTTRVNPLDFAFISSPENICLGEESVPEEPPFLLILCMSEHVHIEVRETIRKTWASVIKGGNGPNGRPLTVSVKLVFILGAPDTMVKKTIGYEETKVYGDIVQVDVDENVKNLTRKSLMGLKWASMFCPRARFVMKMEEDTFIHLENLVTYLQTVEVPSSGLITGFILYHPLVRRAGRWAVSLEEYPFQMYPFYASRNAYVISGDLVPRLFYAAEYMPYIQVEDAFLTGIMRMVTHADLVHHHGFTKQTDKYPRYCSFHNTEHIANTATSAKTMATVWESLYNSTIQNCWTSRRVIIARVSGNNTIINS